MIDPVAIVSAKRTPIGHFLGYFKNISAAQLGSFAIAGALQAIYFDSKQIDEVLMGCVLSAGLGQAPARQAALRAQLSATTPCTTVNKMCGSGMKTIMLAYDGILVNSIHAAVAGGMENMSRAPYLLPEARLGFRMGNKTILDHMQYDGLTDAYEPRASMTEITEQCALQLKITREQQDEFTRNSNLRAIKATQLGFFSNEITPITLHEKNGDICVTDDEGIHQSKLDKISELKPVLKNGTITAANASNISDGAAALILMRESQAKKQNIAPLAKLIAHHTIAKNPYEFPIAPITVIKELLIKINWTIDFVDLFEINEAFAIVPLAAMQMLKIPYEKLNVNGGACILGHPIGASGARIVVTLIHALKQRQLKRGVAALCIGGGEATAVAIEIY